MDYGTSINELEKAAQQVKQFAMTALEAYLLIEEALAIIKGEDHDEKARREANTSVPSEWTTVYPEGYGSVPHEGVPSRMGGVRKSRRGVEKTHDGGDEAEAHPLEVTIVMPKQKPLKIPARERQRVCVICGRAFTWGESGYKNCCSKDCERERLRQVSKKRREGTASTWEETAPRKPSTLDKKLKALEAEGMTYADKQKADTIAKFARIDLEGKI